MLEFLQATVGTWTAVAYAFIAFFVSMMVMNRGSWWIVNITAQKEPLLIAAGVFVMFYYTPNLAYVGLVMLAVGVLSRFTGLFNI